MYYPAGLASLAAFATAGELPRGGVFWLMARLLMDAAGALFGLYLVILMGLLLAGRVMRLRSETADRPPGSSA